MAQHEEIVLWLDRRWKNAIEKHLKGETLQEHLETVLDALCNQLPQREYERISREIYAEDAANREAEEAARTYAAYHVMENGKEWYYKTTPGEELLGAARMLRKYLKDTERSTGKFISLYSQAQPITPEEYQHLIHLRMENTGKVTGVFDLNFDKREFSAVHTIEGWKTWAMQDVSTAVYRAAQKQLVSGDVMLQKLLECLNGKGITSAGHLSARNFSFGEEIIESDGKLNWDICLHRSERRLAQHLRQLRCGAGSSVRYAGTEPLQGRRSGRMLELPSQCRRTGSPASQDGGVLPAADRHEPARFRPTASGEWITDSRNADVSMAGRSLQGFLLTDYRRTDIMRAVMYMTIQQILREKNLSRYQLSKKSGVPWATLADICSGKTTLSRCSAGTLMKLSSTLDIPMEQLITLTVEKPQMHGGKPTDQTYLEKNLPASLDKALREYIQGEKDKVSYMDCLWGELYSAINSNQWSNAITQEQADYLRAKYL